MRPDFFLVLLGTLCLSGSIHGLPTANGDIVPKHLSQGAHNARATVHGQLLDDIEKRAGKKSDKAKGKQPVQQDPTELSDKAKGKQPVQPNPNDSSTSQNPPTPQKGGGGGNQEPQTPANRPVSPSGNGRYKVFYLGNCGEQGRGKELRNLGAPEGTPVRKPAQVPKTPKTPGTADDDEEDNDNLKPGVKHLEVCNPKVPMEFPNYPTSGAFFTSDANVKAKWGNVPAYNAKKLNPCDDDYSFGKVTFPKGQNEALYTPKKVPGKLDKTHFKDQWETEHVMDAQIMKKFFKDMFESNPKIKKSMIPQQWKTTDKGDGYPRTKAATTYNQCSYLEQFWLKRWAAPNGGVSAMTHLLSVYPGDNEFKDELFILPGRLNNMKNQLFSIRGSRVIGRARYVAAPLNQKVDELREAILLIKYLNEPEFQKAWRDVSGRIRDRLQEIEEGPDAHIRKTDDFWYKSKKELTNSDEPTLRDEPLEKYRSTQLSAEWGSWINTFVKQRADKMEDLITEYYRLLVADWDVAKTYEDLSAVDKKAFQARMNALTTQVKQTKIEIEKLAIGTSGQIQGAPPVAPGNSDPDSDSDTPGQPPDSPTPGPSGTQPRPGSVGQQLPVRPKPNNQS